MSEFKWEPGTLPEGWVLGVDLGIINEGFVCGPHAALYQRGPFGLSSLPELTPVYMRFRNEDGPRVRAWLAWYNRHM